jgi:hypothetical protein
MFYFLSKLDDCSFLLKQKVSEADKMRRETQIAYPKAAA